MAESGGESNRDGQPPDAEVVVGVVDEKARLRAQLKATLVELTDLQVEIERLASCKHSPAFATDGVCGQCGAQVR